MSKHLFAGLWLTIIGAAMIAGLVAHDGVPITDGTNLITPIAMLLGGMVLGLIGSAS